MKYEEFGWYSNRIGRYMRIKVYGHYGPAIIAFPCQNKQSDDFYNYGMIDNLSDYLEAGRFKLYCLDANDDETVSNPSWDKGYAAYKLEMYHQYLIQEVLPFIYNKQESYCEPLLVGASMGASHSANHFFRRPDLFSGFIALSASFDLARFFDGYFDDNVYNNSPIHYLRNMDRNHHYIDLYNKKIMIVCIGDGAFEHLVKYTNEELAHIAYEKGIYIWFNFWDQNATHDWSSWKYEMRYFLDKIL